MAAEMKAESFDGRTVMVFGGTSGINLGIAEAFATAGARVAVLSRKPERVEAAVARLSAHGPARGFAADVRDATAVGQAVAAVAADWGPLDVVVSGAAGNFPALARDLSPQGFKAVVDIDLIGTFNALSSCHPHLRRPGAVAMAIGAPQATHPMVGQAHVCAAKAGVEMLVRVLAREWGPEGIRVVSLVPGPVEETEGLRRLAGDPAARDRLLSAIPLRSLGRIAQIADAALFLASDAARHITGTALVVDGGYSTLPGELFAP